jgi:hypothetical protein
MESEKDERKENRQFTVLIIALSALAVVLICGAAFAAYQIFFGRPEPTQDPSIAYTAAARTIVARYTQDAGSTAVAELTQIAKAVKTLAPLPSSTSAPTFVYPTSSVPTYVIPPTATPWIIPTQTIAPPTATYPPGPPCNRATFIADVTIPDGTTLPPNTNFTKIWRVRNDGACSWSSSYALIFTSGTAMTNNLTILVPGVVLPGQSIDLAVDMISPGKPGTYQSNWFFRSPQGEVFGTGSTGANALFARIRVPSQPNPNPQYAYDFSANYCTAQWRTDSGVIGCTNPSTDSRGSVVYLTAPDLENRTENEPGLWTRPNQAANGFIAGQYPPYQVRAGDRFYTELSCKYGSNGCDVTFRLDYILPNGTSGNLGSWREVRDGLTTTINGLDLSSLVGQNVQFVLRMQNNGNASQANGIWFLPSIRNTPPTTTPLPPTVTPTATNTIVPTPTKTATPTATNTLPPYPYP